MFIKKNHSQIPLDKSNATFENTINSTLNSTIDNTFSSTADSTINSTQYTTELDSTKIEDSHIENDHDEVEAEAEAEAAAECELESDDKNEAIENNQDNAVTDETIDVNI